MRRLRASDCSVGLPGGDHPAWGAHVLARRGLEDAWFMLEATRWRSKSVGGACSSPWLARALGECGALLGPTAGAGRRAALPVNVSALGRRGCRAGRRTQSPATACAGAGEAYAVAQNAHGGRTRGCRLLGTGSLECGGSGTAPTPTRLELASHTRSHRPLSVNSPIR